MMRSRYAPRDSSSDGMSVDPLEPRVLLAAVAWTGGAGTDLWSDAGNWSTGAIPTALDDVSIEVPSIDATIRVTGPAAAKTLTSAETLHLSSTLTLSGGSSLASLELLDGELLGPGDVTITGQLNWVNGTMSGPGKVVIAAGATATLDNTEDEVFLSRLLEVRGTARYSGISLLLTNLGGAISIEAGGVFDVAGNGTITSPTGNGLITVIGTLAKSAGGDFPFIGVRVYSIGGTFNITSGQLRLANGGTFEGTTTLTPGLQVESNQFFFSPGSTFTGAPLRVTGFASFYGAPVIPALDLLSGSLAVIAPMSVGVLNIADGTLGGTGSTTVTQSMSWSKGTIAGTAILAAGATGVILGAQAKVLSGAELWVQGAVSYSGSGLRFDGSPTALNIAAGGVFDIAGPGSMEVSSGAGHVINVAGTLLKSAGSASLIRPVVNNAGEVRVSWDMLTLIAPPVQYAAATQTLTGGRWSILSIGHLVMPASVSVRVNEAHITAASPFSSFSWIGALRENRGSLTISGATITVTPDGGTFTNRGELTLGVTGRLIVNGAFVQTSEGDLSVSAARAGTYGSVRASGMVTLGGELLMSYAAGYVPTRGTIFDVVQGSSLAGAFDAVDVGPPAEEHEKRIVTYSATSAQVVVTWLVDLTTDGIVDFSDYLEFLSLFDASDPAADFNGDGFVDFGDYLEFLNQFDETT